MNIGKINVPVGAALAPMAGITDINMRLLCHEQSCAYSVSEMLSAKGYVYAPDRNVHRELLRRDPREGISALQLFGSEEYYLTEAIKRLNETDFSFFDFNMGCPAHKIVQNGEGCALMLNPSLAGRLIYAMVKASQKPLTVKIRAGWDREHTNAAEIARIAEENGACAVTVHPRTRDMFYSGKADWRIIADIKQRAKIPVIGNGDIFCAADAQAMLRETACDAVMVARGAQGNVWIFREILASLRGEPYTPPTYRERADMLLRHLDMQVASLGEGLGVVEMRKHVAWYLQGMPQSIRVRARINSLNTHTQVRDEINRYIDSLEGRNAHALI